MSLTGTTAGCIKIEKCLGHGSMGDVYLGFHQKLKRKVAVKTISQEDRLKKMRRVRLLREARALSQLDHPNICKIYDYVELDRYDLLVLELIEGRGLKDVMHTDLSFKQKLNIAKQLTDGLAAAHEKGIIHRDVKPDNIMVSNDGLVKILDFGISRFEGIDMALQSGESERESFDDSSWGGSQNTRAGVLMGTLAYMSPEQARGETATSHSDVYSLGMLFQELFTGKRPYEMGLSFPVLLCRAGEGDTLPVEGLDEPLTNLIKRTKSLLPEARPSAWDVSQALGKIERAPQRRRRYMMIYAAVAALVCLSFIMLWQANRIRTEAQRANAAALSAGRAADNVGEVSEFLVSLFELMDPNRAMSNTLTARTMLDQGSARLERLSGQPKTRARLMSTMGMLYRKLGLLEKAQPLLEETVTIRRQLMGNHHPETADALTELAWLYHDQDQFKKAEPLIKEAFSIRERVMGKDHPKSAPELHLMSLLNWQLGDINQAFQLAEHCLELRTESLAPGHADIGATLAWLGYLHDMNGNNEEAGRLLEEAVAILKQTPNRHDLMRAMNDLGEVKSQMMFLDEAEKLYLEVLDLAREAYGAQHPLMAGVLNNLGVLNTNRGQNEHSLVFHQQALAMWEKTNGPNSSGVAVALSNIARSYIDLERYQEAEKALKRVLEIDLAVSGPTGGYLVFDHILIADCQLRQNKLEAMRESYAKAFEIAEKSGNLDRDLSAINAENLAASLLESKLYPDAEKLFQFAYDLWGRDESFSRQVPNLKSMIEIMETTDSDSDRLHAKKEQLANLEAKMASQNNGS